MIALNNTAKTLINDVLGIAPQAAEVEVFLDVLRNQLDEVDVDARDVEMFQHIVFVIDAAGILRERAQPLGLANCVAELQARARRKAGIWLKKHLSD